MQYRKDTGPRRESQRKERNLYFRGKWKQGSSEALRRKE